MKLKGLIALLPLMAIGCSGVITKGKVYRKDHEPEKKWIEYEAKDGEKVPVLYVDGEDHVLEVRTTSWVTDEPMGRKFYVDKDTYDKFSLGEVFVYNGNNAETKDPISKRKPTQEEMKFIRIIN